MQHSLAHNIDIDIDIVIVVLILLSILRASDDMAGRPSSGLAAIHIYPYYQLLVVNL